MSPIVSWRKLLRHRADILRNTTAVSDTGVTKFSYVSSIAAKVTTDLYPSDERNIVYKARTPGIAGNSITVTYVNDGPDTPLSVSILGTAITVHLETNPYGVVVSTADDVITEINQSAALVTAYLAQTGGTGVLDTGTWALSGGADSSPAIKTGVACRLQGGKGRLRQEDLGQFPGREFTITFGPEALAWELQQNDLIVVTNEPNNRMFRIVHLHNVLEYGINHLEAVCESYAPGGGD